MSQDGSDVIKRSAKPLVLLAATVTFVLALLLYFMIGGLTDPNWTVWIDRDFVNYWTASRLLLSGQVMDLFSGQSVYFPHLTNTFGPDYPWHNWSYPPHYLLFVLPLGYFPFHVSMVLFLFVTMLVYLHSTYTLGRKIDASSALLILPFVACNIMTAQNGFISGALLLYGLALRDRHPVIAGIAIGLLTVKPQLGILLPALLLFERRWQVILAAAVTTVASIMLSVALFGLESWQGFIEHTVPYQTEVMRVGNGTFLYMTQSLYGALRSYAFDADQALAVHLPLAALVFLGFVGSLFLLKTRDERAFSALLATFLISPYSLSYDLGALSAFAAIWAGLPALTAGQTLARRLVFTGIAFLPLMHSTMATYFGLPIAPAFIAAGLVLLVLFREKAVDGPVSASVPMPQASPV